VAASATAAPALVLSLVSLIGVAYLISAAVLLIKEANFFVDTTSFLFSVASGVLFPIAVLPPALKLVALALPVTYALDLLRAGALGTHPLLPPLWEYLALVALAGVSLPFGRWVFRRTEHHLRVRGTLGQH
jgi:ABC-2 type transport system permease protein